MNTFEVAVLRILIKRQQHQPLKLSTLVSGFPDDAEDNVLSAVSNLRLQGYIMLNDYQPSGYVSINRDRRKEVLQIVDSDIHSHKFESPSPKENEPIPILGKKSPPPVTARHKIPPGHKAIAISSLLIVGLVSTIGISIPVATSPDSGFIAYHGYIAHNKWTSAQGAGDYQGDKISSTISPSFVALKDCNESKSYHHEQT
ncbi:MAG TPA: hypothetical protein VI037_05115 [Nitrososphaera sp.]